ncbi:MAG: HipA domain-containing protein [Opitutales bacterium]|nr:HipA domain-containing protein [Opitutales bacterium]
MNEYPVVPIAPESVLESEQLGTKDKFWFITDDGYLGKSEWLFKFPTENTGQHWAEKIACEIAKQMKILTPRVELAVFEGARGTATENFTKDGYELFHGNQILAGLTPAYQTERRWHQNDHTIGRIFDAIDSIFVASNAAKKAADQMGAYLVLDALICNVDRHHENWGILRKSTPDGMRGRLAPSYDHASSLGRELRDSGSKNNRERYLHELGVAKYIERGRCPIFVDGTGNHGPSPFRLVQRCLEIDRFAPHFRHGLAKLSNLNPAHFAAIIDRVPHDWMSPLAREFTLSLLIESLQQLNDLQR